MSCSLRCTLLATLFIFGLILLSLGLVGLLLVPVLINRIVKQEEYLAVDSNGTDNLMLKMFRDPPYDIKLQVWTISVQNPDGVIANGELPKVLEKGPYTFNIVMHKSNVSFHNNGTRLFFRQQKTYFYDALQSCTDCKLTDHVTIPNILFQKIVDISSSSEILRLIIEPIIKDKEPVFKDVSVDELLFKGYEDELIKMICSHRFIAPICKSFNVPARIGLFYGQNGTDDGLYEVDSGARDSSQLDKVYSWEGMDGRLTSKYWYGDPARLINGTEELFSPNLHGIDKLEIFIGQLCRSFDLEKRIATFAFGLPVFRYAMPETFLDVETQRSQGFCNPNTSVYYHNTSIQQVGCAPSGLLDMSSCLPGSPRIFWSNSHFRNAPAELHPAGMSQPSDDDISYFDIEPITAVIVGVQQRSQLNLGMLRGKLRMTKNMRDFILPLIWINESVAVDSGTKARLLIPITIVSYAFTIGLILIVVGAVCLVSFAGILIALKSSSPSNLNTTWTEASELPHEYDNLHESTSADPLISPQFISQPQRQSSLSEPNHLLQHFQQQVPVPLSPNNHPINSLHTTSSPSIPIIKPNNLG